MALIWKTICLAVSKKDREWETPRCIRLFAILFDRFVHSYSLSLLILYIWPYSYTLIHPCLSSWPTVNFTFDDDDALIKYIIFISIIRVCTSSPVMCCSITTLNTQHSNPFYTVRVSFIKIVFLGCMHIACFSFFANIFLSMNTATKYYVGTAMRSSVASCLALKKWCISRIMEQESRPSNNLWLTYMKRRNYVQHQMKRKSTFYETERVRVCVCVYTIHGLLSTLRFQEVQIVIWTNVKFSMDMYPILILS